MQRGILGNAIGQAAYDTRYVRPVPKAVLRITIAESREGRLGAASSLAACLVLR